MAAVIVVSWTEAAFQSLCCFTHTVVTRVGLPSIATCAMLIAVGRELDADVVGLQEVDAKPHREAGLDQVVYLAEATGLTGIAGPTLTRHYGQYGNALLTRLPVRGATLIDLSVARWEPRGAIDAEVDAHGLRCRLLVTHLGLRRAERAQQLAHLIAAPPRWPFAGLAFAK